MIFEYDSEKTSRSIIEYHNNVSKKNSRLVLESAERFQNHGLGSLHLSISAPPFSECRSSSRPFLSMGSLLLPLS